MVQRPLSHHVPQLRSDSGAACRIFGSGERRGENIGGFGGSCGVDCVESNVRSISARVRIYAVVILPSGNKPVLPFWICFPKYQPSPKSSSRSISSILWPLDKLNSSGLRASKSSSKGHK